MGEIGTPGYTAEAARRAAPARPVPAQAPRAVGALRIRAGVAAVLAGYGWLWTLGAFATPMWTTLGAAVWLLRLAGRSKDAFASAASIGTANVAAGVAGLYLFYALAAPLYALVVQHAGVGA